MSLKQQLMNFIDTIKTYEEEYGESVNSSDFPSELLTSQYMEANGLKEKKPCVITMHPFTGCAIEVDNKHIFIDSPSDAEYFARLYEGFGYEVTVINS